ncbi:MAG: alpha/beta hydrolase [Gammaproteobacteria bacterium]|nr:alpha/beta hydrolase [Gammaproteobacteria bacterium]
MTIERGYLRAPTGQVHYRLAGEGGRPLVLLHQSPLSGAQFQAVLPRLAARGFQALALDMPGFGMSDPAPEPLMLESYASVIPAALTHMGWTHSALVGHHTGAVIAAMHAAAAPASVDALVLNGFPLLTDAERAHFSTFYFGTRQPEADGSHLLRAWESRLRSTPGWSDLDLMHRYTVEALVSGATNWRAFPLILGADLGSLLGAIQVPTMLLTNTGEDLYEATRRSHSIRPDFAYRELIGGSHDIVDEQPEAWTEAVTAFIEGAN